MFRNLIYVFSFFFVLGLTAAAQDKPANEKNEMKEKTGMQEMKHQVTKDENSKETVSDKPWNAVCPVKGNPVEEGTATVEYNGKIYGFCCPGCDTKFAKNPEKYAKNLSEDGKKFIGRK